MNLDMNGLEGLVWGKDSIIPDNAPECALIAASGKGIYLIADSIQQRLIQFNDEITALAGSPYERALYTAKGANLTRITVEDNTMILEHVLTRESDITALAFGSILYDSGEYNEIRATLTGQTLKSGIRTAAMACSGDELYFIASRTEGDSGQKFLMKLGSQEPERLNAIEENPITIASRSRDIIIASQSSRRYNIYNHTKQQLISQKSGPVSTMAFCNGTMYYSNEKSLKDEAANKPQQLWWLEQPITALAVIPKDFWQQLWRCSPK